MIVREEAWMSQAACVGSPELFYPDFNNKYKDIQKAKDICAGCPVRQECLEYASYCDDQEGIWAGLTPQERKVLKP